jgi:hypothetical protein
MKKALILTNLFWVSILLFMAFKPSPDQQKLPRDCNNIVANYANQKPEGLNFAAAIAMANLFKKSHEKTDSRTIWYSLTTLKRHIWEIEHYNCLKPLNKQLSIRNLGVRIYYGMYPSAKVIKDNPTWEGVNPAFAEQETAFLVGTFFDGKINHDFDPILDYKADSARKDWTPKPLSTFIQKPDILKLSPQNLNNFKRAAATLRTIQSGSQNNMQNHGALCPPLCNNQDLAF